MTKPILVVGAMALLILMGLAAGGYWAFRAPASAAPSTVKIAMTPPQVQRGEYLYRLAGCDNCHSPRDWTRFGGPVIASSRGAGFEFPEDMNLPGRIVASNITSDLETGIGSWTDGEKIRAIRDGIGRDGRALYPLMPYRRFRTMSDDDVFSLVAYLNTLPPVRRKNPKTSVSLPVAIRMKDRPRPAGSVASPDTRDRVKYGQYLSTLAGCAQCHTAAANAPGKTQRFAGGRQFQLDGLSVFSANISPDTRSGIGGWSEREFLDRMYLYRDYVIDGSPKVGPENFTVMPWLSYSTLEENDLKAIYAFLKTRKPIYRLVQAHPDFPRE